MMESLNRYLFLALNAPADPNPALLACGRIMAEDLVFVAALLAVVLWVWGDPGKRHALIAAGGGLIVAFAISWIIGLAWYHPRPFAIGLGHSFVAHAPDSSFPSDHTTFLWTFGLSLLAMRIWARWGWALMAAGLATAWARIYVGVHYPFDMVGSLLVASLGTAAALVIDAHAASRVLPLVEGPYKFLLRRLHLNEN